MRDTGTIWSWFANTKFGMGSGIMVLIIGTASLVLNEQSFKRPVIALILFAIAAVLITLMKTVYVKINSKVVKTAQWLT